MSVAGEIKITKFNLRFFLHFNNAFFGNICRILGIQIQTKKKNGIAKKLGHITSDTLAKIPTYEATYDTEQDPETQKTLLSVFRCSHCS